MPPTEPLLSEKARRATDIGTYKGGPLQPLPTGKTTSQTKAARYTMAMPSEKQFNNVKVCVSSKMLEYNAKKMNGKLARRMTQLAEKLAPATEPDDPMVKGPESDTLQTNGEAIVNLLNNCLGSSMLGIAYSLSQTGVGVGLVAMFVSLCLNKFTLLLHQETCKIAVADPTSAEIAEKTFGNKGKTFMNIVYSFFGFFCMVAMVNGTADAAMGIVSVFVPPESMPPPLVNLFLCWLVLLFPPTLVRSLKSVATLSLVAFIGGLVLIACVLVSCGRVMLTNGIAFDQISWSCEPAVFFQAFPVLLLIFSIQAGGGVVLATLKDTSEANVVKVANNTYVLVYSLDVIIGLTAYLTFLDKTESDVIKNLPSDPVSFVGRVGLLVLMVLSYMIMCIPCKFAAIEMVFHKNEAMMESSPFQFYITVLVVNVACLAVSVCVPNLGPILGINGAVFTNLCAFLMPVAFNLKAKSNPANPDYEPLPIMSLKNWKYHFIFLFGSLCLVVSTYSVITTSF